MAFIPKDWRNAPDMSTPVSAEALEDLEVRLAQYVDTSVSAVAPNIPTANEKAALGGTSGAPTSGNKFVTDADARNADARTPTAHVATHQPGGSDPLAVDAAATVGSLRTLGTGTQQAMPGNDSRVYEPGDLKISARSTPSTGWLLCDGSAVSRTLYANLFVAIGTTYGAGDNSTTFNVPDLRGRAALGADPSGATIPNTSNRALGQTGGEERHSLTVAEMPPHDHPLSLTRGWVSSGNPNQNIAEATDANTGLVSAASGLLGQRGGSGGIVVAHNNMQPYQMVNYFIKT